MRKSMNSDDRMTGDRSRDGMTGYDGIKKDSK
jgi:hypothetical protein